MLYNFFLIAPTNYKTLCYSGDPITRWARFHHNEFLSGKDFLDTE